MRQLSLVLLAISLLVPVTAAGGQMEAKERFEKGVDLYKNGDYEGALVEFMSAYEAKPHFAVRYNIGICLYKLHRYSEARTEMEAYLDEGGAEIPVDKRKEIESILVELEGYVGTLEVKCNVEGAELRIDGEKAAVLPVDGKLNLDVGEYDLEIAAQGYEPHTAHLIIAGGKSKTVEVELSPLPEEKTVPAVPAPKRRKTVPAPVFWTGACLAVALAAGGAVTGGLALQKHEEYDGLGFDDPGWKDTQREGRTLALASNVLWGATGAVAIATFVVAFFTDFKGSGKEAKVGLVPDLENPGLAVTGVF